VLRDIKTSVGAVTLTELIRFRDQAEGAASLALRSGDTAAIGFYLDRDRVHVGDLAAVTDHAYIAWSTDRAAGLDTIMLAPTRDLVTGLNVRARDDRLVKLGRDGQDLGQQVALVDGSAASEGDLVITRRNNRQLRTNPTDWVKNGDRRTVSSVHNNGSLDVVHTHTGRRITLPVAYVAGHVQLGYATTVHGGQGVTADTSHTVSTGEETRQQLYVALTRGRDGNHLYLAVAMDGDEHSVITPAATHPQTAINVLEQVLARDEAQISATTARQQLADPHTILATADARYRDSLGHAAAHIQGPGWVENLENAIDQVVPGITDSPAWPTLRGNLALLAADGHDPVASFTTALRSREIDTAADVAAVLDWRLEPTHTRSHTPGPLPWLPGIPKRLADDPNWSTYLTARSAQVSATVVDVRAAAEAYTVATAPGGLACCCPSSTGSYAATSPSSAPPTPSPRTTPARPARPSRPPPTAAPRKASTRGSPRRSTSATAPPGPRSPSRSASAPAPTPTGPPSSSSSPPCPGPAPTPPPCCAPPPPKRRSRTSTRAPRCGGGSPGTPAPPS